jgi:hypothetical protein
MTTERPRPIHDIVKRYNYQHLHECQNGALRVQASGETFTGGRVEFNTCAPFDRDILISVIDEWEVGEYECVADTKRDHAFAFLHSLADALCSAAASSGDVIDRLTISLLVLD